jgi:hypothetical protein
MNELLQHLSTFVVEFHRTLQALLTNQDVDWHILWFFGWGCLSAAVYLTRPRPDHDSADTMLLASVDFNAFTLIVSLVSRLGLISPQIEFFLLVFGMPCVILAVLRRHRSFLYPLIVRRRDPTTSIDVRSVPTP